MKKLIIILFLFPVILKAQLSEDNVYHSVAGYGISQTSFLIINELSNDYKLSFRASSMLVITGAFGKEYYDSFTTGNFSFKDIGFTCISGIITSYLNRQIFRKINKKKKVQF